MNGVCVTDSLFFTVFPDEAAAVQIAELNERLRTQHTLKTRPIPAGRLHVTLQYTCAFDGFPADIAEKTIKAAETIALPPVDITLDHIESFSSRRPKRPLVFSGDASETCSALVKALQDTLTEQGLETRRHSEFKPHITLLYDEHRIPK
ncbi:putative ligase protein [Candidatus Burkholderia pumila]|uniref:Ligase protein n=1 Tax=Candidatus Burkholderia pumila TaxID=1090375 RepID=A0ABR5HM61_9BURK|nr:putative ligase protein [Candidatus Burkholderia pumila]